MSRRAGIGQKGGYADRIPLRFACGARSNEKGGASKKNRHAIACLFFLRRVDKKDAVSKIIIIYDIYRSFLEFYLPIRFCLQL